MKRLSRTIMTAMLVALLAFSLVSCQSTAKVREIPPAPVVEQPAPEPVAAPVAEVPATVEKVAEPVKAAEPEKVAEPVKVEPSKAVAPEKITEYPYGVKLIEKNTSGSKVFDLFIVHTNDIDGNIYAENGGMGIAKLSTMLTAAKGITDNWLLLNSGSVGELPASAFQTAANVIDTLGYDAYTPQAIQLATGIAGTKKALPLCANALDANGYLVTQPYQVYDFNGFKVAVVGLAAPKNIQGVSFTSDVILQNAQAAIDMAKKYVDYIIVLGDLGSKGALSSDFVCQNLNGIDLFVDGNGGAEAKTVNGTLIVRADQSLQSIGAVQLHVENGAVTATYPMILPAKDVLDPAHSPIAKSFAGVAQKYGYSLASIPEDPAIVSLIGPSPVKKAVVPAKAATPAPAPAPVVTPAPAKAPAVVPAVAKAPEPIVYPYGVKEIQKNEDGAKEFDLFVVHTNDVHGRVVPADGGMGYSKLATLLKMGRALTNNILLLDAGDVSHGTNLVNMFQGEPVGVLLDMLGYDAVAPGNHDFNYGKDRLIAAAKYAEANSNLKVLSANILDKNGYLVFQPYQVYDFNGFKVAVVGLTTPDTATKTNPKNVEGLSFMDPVIVNNAQAAVDMAKKYVDYIIVLGHIGLDPDGPSGITSEMICKNIKGINLFVDGHSHTTLPQGKKVGDTLIVQTGSYLQNVGVVQIHVKNGKVTATYPMLIPAKDVLDPKDSALAKTYGITDIPNDPKVDEYISYMTAKLGDKLNKVIATVPETLDGERANVRTRQTNLSKIITMAMTKESGADFSITNGGGIRTSIAAGNVTVGDVVNVLPFTNIITVCEIKGSEVYAALEHGYSMLPETNGAYAQTDLKVVYNRYAAPGKRILRVLLGNGKILDKNATYKVATNDFMAAGGDGYTMFGKVIKEGSLLSDVLASYLTENYPVK